MAEYKHLQISEWQGTLEVILNRPDVHNAFNRTMIDELTQLFGSLTDRQGIRMVVLTSSGRTFCAGADLGMMKEAADYSYEENVAEGRSIYDLMLAVDSCPRPVIGRINGSAFGGGVGLVSCCDIAVAVDRAQFSFSETRLGLVPAVISPFVINKIGSANARRLFLTGERFDAEKAMEIGLISQVVAEAELDDAVAEIIQQLEEAAPGAQAAAKRLIQALPTKEPEEIRDYLAALIAERRASTEGKEGMSAFLNKRSPSWRKH